MFPVCIATLALALTPPEESGCLECHDRESAKGRIVLEGAAFSQHSLWRRAEEQLRAGLMPPTSEPPLGDEARKRLIEWIGEGRRKAFATAAPHAPNAPVRRLNRSEYEACLEQLFGSGLFQGPGALPRLPADDLMAGFDTIGSSLGVNPLWTRLHLEICRSLLERELPEPGQGTILLAAASFQVVEGLGQVETEASLWTNGRLAANFSTPSGGAWKLRLFASCNEVGQGPGRLRCWINGKAGETFDCDASGKGRDIEVDLRPGENRVELEFLNDFYEPARKLDRNFQLARVEFRNAQAPSLAAGLLQQEGGLKSFARLAWRRQPAESEWPPFAALAVPAPGESRAAALRRAAFAVLAAPAFVFRIESRSAGLRPLPEVELASRLSFFLSGAAPDEILLASAEAGRLRRDLKSHFDRLVDGSDSLGRRSAGLGFGFHLLEEWQPQGDFAAVWKPSLRLAARRQAELVLTDMIRRDRPARELVDASWTWLDRELAQHYRLPWSGGDGFRRVELPTSELRRGGLLGTLAFAAVTSRPRRSSPVLRGSAVLGDFLARPPPPAPPDAGSLAESGPAAQGNARERLAAHRSKASCASCHRSIDPLGFALEELDPLGRFRPAGSEDFSGHLPDGRRIVGLRQLQQILAAEEFQLRRALALKFFILALGREPEDADEALLDRLSRSKSGVRGMLWELVNSDAFQKHGSD
ncbi:MAG: hypothetical protein RL095_3836 [Verrucomicrobiota bacterium]|jgi:hypothetical protein